MCLITHLAKSYLGPIFNRSLKSSVSSVIYFLFPLFPEALCLVLLAKSYFSPMVGPSESVWTYGGSSSS